MTKDSLSQSIKKIDNITFIGEVSKMLNKEGRKSVTFTLRGYSMRPFLENGRDKVILIKPQKPQIGQVILAEFEPKKSALHRIIKVEGNIITMRGDGNSLSQTETFTADKIVGTAIAFIRKGKRVNTTDRKWKIYSTLWKALTPLRRILLGIHRRIIKFINI